MICIGNVFTVFDQIRFCKKQSRENSWAKWRFFQALTGGKICMLLNIPVMIWQSFDFGTIISGQVLGMLRRGRNTGSLNALLVFTERFYLKRSFVRNVQAYTCDMTVLQSRNQYISAGLQRPKLWATLGSHTEIELIESSQLVKIFSMTFSSI